MKNTQVQSLNYGVSPGTAARVLASRHWRVTILVFLAAILTWLPFELWPWLWPDSAAYWEHKCRGYVAPTGLVVYDEDPGPGLRYDPDGPWQGGAWVDGTRVPFYCPNVWHNFYTRSAFSGCYHGYNVAFLHERSNRRGSHLVAAFFKFHGPGQRDGVEVFGRSTPNLASPMRPAFHIFLTRAERFRAYAGQPDPADASHFTIKYEIDHVPGTIDGWLQPDASVKLQLRDGPALAAVGSQAAAPASRPFDR